MITTIYFALIVAVALERGAELVVSQRNLRWAKEQGGVEYGHGHYPAMVGLHVVLLIGCVVEVLWLDRPAQLWLAAAMTGLVAASQGLRWWCIATLGRQWNTRVVVVPGLTRVARGPYRWARHPNYLAVVVEGAALPLVHGAWLTATAFSILNALLLRIRIRSEERALSLLAAPAR